MTSPLSIPPVQDVGSGTFERYRYQAKALLTYAVACARGDLFEGESILTIVLEHHEDVLVEWTYGWVSIQIKTRNENLGPWRWDDVSARGGALHHLAETARRLGTISRNELWLEGAILAQDRLNVLADPLNEQRDTETLARLAAAYWGWDVAEVEAFLRNTLVRCVETRRVVEAVGMNAVAGLYPGHTMATVRYVVDRFLARLTDAIEARWESEDLLEAIVRGTITAQTAERVAQKRLSQVDLEPLVRLLRPVLIRSLTPSTPVSTADSDQIEETAPSDLVRKLTEAGASDPTIISAQTVRAAASVREQEWLASSRADELRDARLDNLRERLLSIARPVADMHRGQYGCAGKVITDLRRELRDGLGQLDVPGLVANDPEILLGFVFQLSDECKTDWGGPCGALSSLPPNSVPQRIVTSIAGPET